MPEAHDDLADALAQLTATSEILAAMGRSASDLEAVLGTVVESARRLCRADSAQIYLLEDGAFRVSPRRGVSDDYRDYMAQHPIVADRATLAGRVALDRRAQQIPDVLADPEYGRPDVQRVGGFRTTLGVPMLIEDEVVGVLSLWRSEVDAVQRACDRARHDVRRAGRDRHPQRRPGAGAAEPHHASSRTRSSSSRRCGEIGQAVSSSLDLDEVLTTIVTHSVQLTDTDGGSLLEYDDESRAFRILRGRRHQSRAARSTAEHPHHRWTARWSVVPARAGQPRSVPDLDGAVLDPHLRRLHEAGWRSVLAVPMLHEGVIVGALVVRRRTAGDFSQDTAELLQTFASQSALAIVNARLFRELEHKTGELQVASRHKSEFLASMSHELRTPLNAVIGFSEVLLQRMFGDINDRQEDYLRDILGSGRHLLELLNDILDLSKVEAGRMELEPSTFSVRGGARVRPRDGPRTSRRARHHARRSMSTRRRRRHRDRRAALQAGRAQPAVQRGEVQRGRRPRVGARGARGRRAARSPSPTTGIGVAPEDRERIFESFQQGGRTRGQERGHRPGADALPTHRRAVRRPDVARQRGRGGQHVRLLRPAGRP